MTWTRGADDPTGRALAEAYRVGDARALTSCSTCHR
jgi:hypothetical protein